MLRATLVRLRALFRPAATEAELDDELRFHLDAEIERLIARGVDPRDAERTARRAFGNVAGVKDAARDTWTWPLVQRVGLAFRFALRSFRKSPGFVVLATVSLGAALGLAATVFGLIDAMTHPESPYRDVDRIASVGIFHPNPKGPSALTIERAAGAIPGVMQVATIRSQLSRVEAGGVVDLLLVVRPLSGFFDVVDVTPRLGRLPTADEVRGDDVALVSDALWRRRFENRGLTGNPSVAVEGKRYRVIGVLPPRANYLGGGSLGSIPYVWVPGVLTTDTPMGTLVMRLEKDVPLRSLYPAFTALFRGYSQKYLTANDVPFGVTLQSLRPNPLQVRDYHEALVGASLAVLLVACANVAALMLARSVVRRRDYGLRIAIGASRGDIARDVIAEVVLLAVFGAVAGLLIARWGFDTIAGNLPQAMISLGFRAPQWSGRVLGLSAAAVFGCVAIAGGYPAWSASRVDPIEPLKEASGNITGRVATRFRWLVIAELALAMMLVMGTSLMSKSLRRMEAYDFGYDARGLLQTNIRMLGGRFSRVDPTTLPGPDSLLAALRATPGVHAAATTSSCRGLQFGTVVTPDRSSGDSSFAWLAPGGGPLNLPSGCSSVSADFFRTLGLQLVDGRDFEAHDAARGAAILDEPTARLLFPKERAVGRFIKLGSATSRAPWLPVVGIVRGATLGFNPYPELGTGDRATVYAFSPVKNSASWRIVVRPERGAAAEVAFSIAGVMRSILPEGSASEVVSWTADYENRVTSQRYLMIVFGLLGAVALLLSLTGLFSVLSYVVNQRMREFSVRVALGAPQRRVAGLVIASGLEMILGGTAIGAGLGMWSGFLIWNLLYGMYPADVGALVAAESVLMLAATIVCFVPALRATRVDPVNATRAT